ncbi:MAG: 2-hydroxyacid dehydrogenase [Burkholderiaceae bacterium]
MTIIHSAPLPADLLAQLQTLAPLIEVPPGVRPQTLIGAEQRASVVGMLCTLATRVDADLLDCFANLKIVSNVAVGFDNVELEQANRRRVLVCNTPGVLDAAVADLTMGLVLCLARNLVAAHEFVRSGGWRSGSAPFGSDLAGKTLGLLGMGRIGSMVARRARAFDMRVIYYNRKQDQAAEAEGLATRVSRDELFAQSDYVSVHVPLTDETRMSIGTREFELMQPHAKLINTSRGAVVDEAALIRALRTGRIAGAGLDVMAQEPLDPSSELCRLPNVVLQPHAGSATTETRRSMRVLAVDNLRRALCGEAPRAMVNPQVWPIEVATSQS